MGVLICHMVKRGLKNNKTASKSINSPSFEEVEHDRVRVLRRGVKSSDLS